MQKFPILFTIICLIATIQATVDYGAMEKSMKALQSAYDRQSDDEFAEALEIIANAMPNDVMFYGAGISVGPRADLVLVKTQSLYGAQYSVPMNPARRTSSSCLYIDNQYTGAIVLVTETPTSIPTCQHNKYTEMTTNLPFRPIYAEGNTIRTSQNFSKESNEGFSHIYAKNPGWRMSEHSVAVEASKINPSSFTDSDNTWILAGTVVELKYGAEHVKYFTVAQAYNVRKHLDDFVHYVSHTGTQKLQNTLNEVLSSANVTKNSY